MIHVVSFSGGRTSAYLVYLMEQKRKQHGWDIRYVFADTGAEHPETYVFIKKVVEHFGIELNCIQSVVHEEMGKGNTWKKVAIDDLEFNLDNMRANIKKYGHFTIKNPFCTDRLKTIPLDKFCRETFGKGNFINWLGMRADEPNRLKNLDTTGDMFGKRVRVNPNIRYLAEISDYCKEDVLEFWAGMPFDLQIKEHLGNCVFCIKKDPKKIAIAARNEPELARQWNELIKDESIRMLPANKYPKGVIYRHANSLDSIIAMFSDIPTEDIMYRMVKQRGLDSWCTESCEAQLDMLSDESEA